jgi:hypothetical protein
MSIHLLLTGGALFAAGMIIMAVILRWTHR